MSSFEREAYFERKRALEAEKEALKKKEEIIPDQDDKVVAADAVNVSEGEDNNVEENQDEKEKQLPEAPTVDIKEKEAKDFTEKKGCFKKIKFKILKRRTKKN